MSIYANIYTDIEHWFQYVSCSSDQTRPDDNDDDDNDNDYNDNDNNDYDDYDDDYDGDYDVVNLSQLLMQNSHSLLMSSFDYTS